MVILLLLVAVNSYSIFTINLDSEYKEILDSVINQLPESSIHVPLNNLEELMKMDIDLVDALIVESRTTVEKSNFERFSQFYQIPTLILSEGANKNFTFYSEYSDECFGKSIISITEFLSLSEPSFVWTFSYENSKIFNFIQKNSYTEFSYVSLSESLSIQDVASSLSNILKQKGIMNYIFLHKEDTCESFSQGFETSYLTKKGNVALFFTECIYQAFYDGYLFLTYKSFEYVKSKNDYKLSKLKKFLNPFIESDLPKNEILQKLQSLYNSKCEFSIVNIQAGQLKIIGTLEDSKISLNDTIIYIGSITNLTNYKFPTIVISANTGSFNPNGAPRAYSNIGHQQGTQFAVEKINRDHLLFPHHILKLYGEVDCGVSIFDYNYSKSCFTHHRPEMGVVYIPTIFSITLPILKQLSSLNLSLPFIGGIGSSGLLSNKHEYPYFTRTCSPSSDFASAWANLIRLYGWTKIIAHYTNDSFGTTAYRILNNSQETYGFKFINDEKFRPIDLIFDNQTVKLYAEHMKDSISLGCNIHFLMMGDPTPYFWFEGLYDLGVRRGDFTFVLFTSTGLSNFEAANANVKKRKELMHGTLLIFNGAWVGEYGAQVKQEYLKYRESAWGRSYFIDAVYSAGVTSKLLIDQGKAYEDKDVFMSALRNVRFLGATGMISFSSDSNDRNIYYYNVFNFYEDKDGTWHDEAVALISPLSTVYYTVLKDTVWVSGEMPKSMKEYYSNCPFRKDQIQDSSRGVAIKISVSIVLLFISSVLTVYSLKRLRFRKIIMLKIKAYIVFEDYLTLGFIFIEVLQMISIGPSFSAFNQFLSNISEILSLNLSKVTRFKDTTFWVIFLSMLSISYFWIFILISSYFRIFRCFSSLLRRIEEIKIYLIPIVSNYLFLPTIVSLISILMCDKSISGKSTDSYLNYDCNTFCWRDSHIVYSFLSSIQFIIYIPLAILYRTIWQEENKVLNIRTNSVYLIIKNLTVVVLVILGKILKDDFELVHGIVFLVVVFLLFVLVLILKNPYNYDRANLWCKIMIVCVLWNTIVCLIGNFVLVEIYAAVILQISGWICIGVFGVFLQSRLPENALVSAKGRSIVELFKFAFGVQSFHKSIYALQEYEIENLVDENK